MLVVGDREEAESNVSVRLRTGEQLAAQSLDSFKQGVKQAMASRTQELNL